MKFPYGIADFYKLITEGYFYVDRTDRIPLIEDTGPQLLFLRPRRFGKSLLLSMLETYYDVARADEFDTLFGHLAIGRHPTPLHNQHLIMRWDFYAHHRLNDDRPARDAAASAQSSANSAPRRTLRVRLTEGRSLPLWATNFTALRAQAVELQAQRGFVG